MRVSWFFGEINVILVRQAFVLVVINLDAFCLFVCLFKECESNVCKFVSKWKKEKDENGIVLVLQTELN